MIVQCANCGRVRLDKKRLESIHIDERGEAWASPDRLGEGARDDVSHTVCALCARALYPTRVADAMLGGGRE